MPANSVSVTSGTLAAGDSLTGATYTYLGTGSTTYGSSTTAPTNAGTYSITPSAAVISAGEEANYNITYTVGTLTITPLTVTVTPDSGQTKVFGSPDPTYTYTTSPSRWAP